MDGIVLSPQPMSRTGCPFPQAEIARIRKQGGINDLEAKVMLNCPVLHDFFNPLQSKDYFLVKLRVLKVLNVLGVFTTFPIDVARYRRDKDRPCIFEDLRQLRAAC
jgi:hypothetical protein